MVKAGERIQFNPPVQGPFIASMADLETKATFRETGIAGDARLFFDGEGLKMADVQPAEENPIPGGTV